MKKLRSLRVALMGDHVGSGTAMDVPSIREPRAGEAVIVLASGNRGSRHPITSLMIVTRLVALTAMLVAGNVALATDDLERIVERNIQSMLSSGGAAGAAVAL